jgi:hypothetical protein
MNILFALILVIAVLLVFIILPQAGLLTWRAKKSLSWKISFSQCFRVICKSWIAPLAIAGIFGAIQALASWPKWSSTLFAALAWIAAYLICRRSLEARCRSSATSVTKIQIRALTNFVFVLSFLLLVTLGILAAVFLPGK